MQKNYKFFHHLKEIKYRAGYLLLSFILSFGCVFYFLGELTYFITKPLNINLERDECLELIYTNISEAFLSTLSLSFFCAVIYTAPLLYYHLYGFLLPGIYKYELKKLKIIFGLSSIFYFGSFVLAYKTIIPFLWDFFLGYDLNIDKSIFELRFEGKIVEYTNLCIQIFKYSFIIGQVPLIILLLLISKLISSEFLKKSRTWYILFCFIFGALISPPDVLSQILIAVPLCLAYEIGIIFGIITQIRSNYTNEL